MVNAPTDLKLASVPAENWQESAMVPIIWDCMTDAEERYRTAGAAPARRKQLRRGGQMIA